MKNSHQSPESATAIFHDFILLSQSVSPPALFCITVSAQSAKTIIVMRIEIFDAQIVFLKYVICDVACHLCICQRIVMIVSFNIEIFRHMYQFMRW